MDAVRLLRVTARDGSVMTAAHLVHHAQQTMRVDGQPSIVVLFGEAGSGKSRLTRWFAGQFAAAALQPGAHSSTPLLLDLEKRDLKSVDGDGGVATGHDMLDRLAARQLGPWAEHPAAAEDAKPVWIIDHVEALNARSVDGFVASVLRRPGLKVLACAAPYWRLTLQPAFERGAAYRDHVEVEPFEVIGLPDLPSQRSWIASELGEDEEAAAALSEVVHAHWDLAHSPRALEVAVRFARRRGLDELRRELTDAGAGVALLDDYLEALWIDHHGVGQPLGSDIRGMMRQLGRAVLAATDHPTECAGGEPLASLHYCGVEDVVKSDARHASHVVETLVDTGFLRVEVTQEGVRYHLPSPSFAARYAVAETARHPVTPRPSSWSSSYLGQLVAWLVLRPEAWRRYLRAIGDLESTAILSEVAQVRRSQPRRLLALLAVVPLLVGAAAAVAFGAATMDWSGAAEIGWTALAVAAAGGFVLAQGAGVGFALTYMLVGGLVGSLLAGVIGAGGLAWLRDAVVSHTEAGVSDAQVGIAYFAGLALCFVAGLKGLSYRRPPLASVRQRFVSTSSLTTAVIVTIPLAAFVAFGVRAEHAAPAHLRDVFIGTVALFFFAAAVHWRTRNIATTVAATLVTLAAYAAFAFAPWPSWDLVSTGAQSAIIWGAFFSVGYSVLRDFLFPIGQGKRFELDEGSVAALAVAFAVSLAGFSMVIAGATGDPFRSLVVGLGLIVLGLAQRWWRAAAGSLVFAPWDLWVARSGRIQQHSATWDEYHELPRAGLSTALTRALKHDPEAAKGFLAYFSRTAAAPATTDAWERIAFARAEACRTLDDIAAMSEPLMVDVLRKHAPQSTAYELLTVASRVAEAQSTRDPGLRRKHLTTALTELHSGASRTQPGSARPGTWRGIIERGIDNDGAT